MINEQICSCIFTKGHTWVIQWGDKFQAICMVCHSPIHGLRLPMMDPDPAPPKFKPLTNRIQGDLQDPSSKHDHEIILDVSLFGKAAYSCSLCGGITFWQGSKQLLERMTYSVAVLGANVMACPKCQKLDEIPAEWRVMFS